MTGDKPTLVEAIKRLRTVQMAWNNTHSRRESNTYECFDVVLGALEGCRHVINSPDELHAAIRYVEQEPYIDLSRGHPADEQGWSHLQALVDTAKALLK